MNLEYSDEAAMEYHSSYSSSAITGVSPTPHLLTPSRVALRNDSKSAKAIKQPLKRQFWSHSEPRINLGKVSQKPVARRAEPLSAWYCRILPIARWGPTAYIDQVALRTLVHSCPTSRSFLAMALQQNSRFDLPGFTLPLDCIKVRLGIYCLETQCTDGSASKQ